MCLLHNPASLEILQPYKSLICTDSVRRDLTCELHSAVILIPLPWSCHHANQKVSVASARSSPALCFRCLRRFGMQKSQSRSPSSASLSIQLLGSSWTIAALRSLAFPLSVWDARRPPCKQRHNLPGMGRHFIFPVPREGGRAERQRKHSGWGGRGCGQEETPVKQKHVRCWENSGISSSWLQV